MRLTAERHLAPALEWLAADWSSVENRASRHGLCRYAWFRQLRYSNC